jgi:serine/threonine protein kinase
MEYLPGEDMYQIRERVMTKNNTALLSQAERKHAQNHTTNNTAHTTTMDPSTITTRRIAIEDAVYLTADVMLPLLRSIHQVGVVHRDVKPSNCVRKNEMDDCKEFCLVDFGLSKSIIVAEDSDHADIDHPWMEGNPWMKPLNYTGTKAYYRKERTKADFRGTSMYASLRVHQGKDYCARDDMWSLMYVFCDLVSGGLPWMSMAANRDRTACQTIKEWIHGERPNIENTNGDDNDNNYDGSPNEHHIDELLKGDLYHIAKYRRDRQKESKVENDKLVDVPEPLQLSLQKDKVAMLQGVFEHLAGLQFWDMPDYDLIEKAIHSFRENRSSTLLDPAIPFIDWSVKSNTKTNDHRPKHWWGSTSNIPEWILLEDDKNRMDENIFDDIEVQKPNRSGHDDYRSRLPIELQFHLAQMDYNLVTAKEGSVPLHRALHDWMRVAVPLLYHEWNARDYEDGGHRTATDGFKRPHYLDLLRLCVTYANAFDNFQSRDCYYEPDSNHSDHPLEESTNNRDARARKRRKVLVRSGTTIVPHSDLILVSKTLFGLQRAIRVETSKKTAPPVRISFG